MNADICMCKQKDKHTVEQRIADLEKLLTGSSCQNDITFFHLGKQEFDAWLRTLCVSLYLLLVNRTCVALM